MAPRPTVNRQTVERPVRTGRIRTAKTKKEQATKVSADQLEAAINDQALEPVCGTPPAWSEGRQQLCDAIPWFRCTQGAMYHNEGFCFGFLIDADGGTRTYIDEEIIITRIGGCCTKDSGGNLTLEKNQDSDNALVQSIMASQNSKLAVGLVIGSKNKILNRKLPHRYNIMDWFRVTNVWFEKIGQKHGVKVRFEKLNLEETSWWAGKDSLPPVPLDERDFEIKPETVKCERCSMESVRLYEEGWMCLEPSCVDFWKIENALPPAELTFNADFLSFRSRPDQAIQPHYSLVPDLLSTLDENTADVSTSRIAWKGIVCPMCLKCIRRTFWQGWKCDDDSIGEEGEKSCPFQKFMNMNPISLRVVLDHFELAPIKRAILFDRKFSIPEVDDNSFFPYRKLTYKLDGVGSITHFVSNKAINSRATGPDDLFINLQRGDLGLKRFRLQSSLVAGTLTSHFAVNYGMPYKYVVSVDSKGFDEAPNDMLQALGRLSWATEKAVISSGDKYLPPNELLTLGYFEEMKIGFHDDGESSLGPTIATLSLGAKATMLVRMKYKYFNGSTRRADTKQLGTLLQDDPVLKDCLFEGERRTLKKEYDAGEIPQGEYDDSRRALSMGRKGKEAPVTIKMELHHGDLVVMHGENLQKYYEHSVVPENKLRFALTARYVKPDYVDAREIQKGQFSLTSDQIYDGK
ncbi:Oxoglutarate/iron-dependent dioxygenase [Penicillium digitatum]|uniref:Oxoglutarate/iron-dependent dioxygenase n=1 Tax=Penicillium digitatum TaxID=36651 RepID=A0A7T7BKI7_PENDI|nr:Oxoglutarate/iron-dependent dioxygenase [Penicillium digitatum]